MGSVPQCNRANWSPHLEPLLIDAGLLAAFLHLSAERNTPLRVLGDPDECAGGREHAEKKIIDVPGKLDRNFVDLRMADHEFVADFCQFARLGFEPGAAARFGRSLVQQQRHACLFVDGFKGFSASPGWRWFGTQCRARDYVPNYRQAMLIGSRLSEWRYALPSSPKTRKRQQEIKE
jgi:hypothetical protein